MSIKLVWKGFMFTLSILMLLLTLGYGRTPSSSLPAHTAVFSGQAKVASVGARTSGFKSVNPPVEPVIEKTIWDKMRDKSEEWMGGGQMKAPTQNHAKRSELQNLQRRSAGQATATTMAVQKRSF